MTSTERDPALKMLLARSEILQNMAAYCRYADLFMYEEQAALYTEDCKVSYGGPDKWEHGRSAVTAKLLSSLPKYSETHHLIGGVEIDFVSADRAHARSTIQAWHRHVEDRPDFILRGYYIDEWALTDDGWRIASRQIVAAGVEGRDDVSGLNRLDRRSPTAG